MLISFFSFARRPIFAQILTFSSPLTPKKKIRLYRLNRYKFYGLTRFNGAGTLQVNANTHFLDASEVYGSTEDITHRLRAMEGGLLKTSTGVYGQTFCPYLAKQYRKPEFQDYKVQYDTGLYRKNQGGNPAKKRMRETHLDGRNRNGR